MYSRGAGASPTTPPGFRSVMSLPAAETCAHSTRLLEAHQLQHGLVQLMMLLLLLLLLPAAQRVTPHKAQCLAASLSDEEQKLFLRASRAHAMLVRGSEFRQSRFGYVVADSSRN